jgi:hypothetical protein
VAPKIVKQALDTELATLLIDHLTKRKHSICVPAAQRTDSQRTERRTSLGKVSLKSYSLSTFGNN